ncbi:hypothetical protein MSKU15_3545 [Komagataeibacter diospyri]|nr:hypothetical protein MSKU15_3545 [Komagataeibacter diospyri]
MSSTGTVVKSPPFPSKVMLPPRTTMSFRLPLASISGVPVARVTWAVLMNPHPAQVMPLGLATTTEAWCPATSV